MDTSTELMSVEVPPCKHPFILIRLAENAARCLHDPRDSHKVKHDLLTLVRQRRFAIAQGYEDNNDTATLAKDPAFKIMAGKAPENDGDLASQPARSRLENRVTAKDLRRLSDWFLDLYPKGWMATALNGCESGSRASNLRGRRSGRPPTST
jgi:hypothetical protein